MSRKSPPPQPHRNAAPIGDTIGGVRRAVVVLMTTLVALFGMSAVMVSAAPAATADSTSGNKMAGIEKSLVLLQTTWTGYIQVPAQDDAAGKGFWTKQLSYSVTCTGFYVSKTAQIVTAGHCVDPAEGREVMLEEYLQEQNASNLLDDAKANWHVEGATQGSAVDRSVEAIQPRGVDGATITSLTTVQVVDYKATDNGDVALLQVPNMTQETPALSIADKAPQVGDPITAIGFPGALREIADQSQIARASFKTGSVSSQQVSPQGVTEIEVSAALSGGMSGGPTVNQQGEVIGVNSSGLVGHDDFNFITDTPDLRAFLLSHNVVLAQPAAPHTGTGVLWYVIGGAAGVLVLALGAGTFLVIRRRPNAQPGAAGVAAPLPSPVPIGGNASAAVPMQEPRITPAPSHPADPAARNSAPLTSAPEASAQSLSGAPSPR